MNFQNPESTFGRRSFEPTRPAQAVAITDDARARILERRLLMTFVIVAALSMLWHLGTNLQWVWANCISHLHSALMQGIS